jgi:hypothetical protein
MQHTLRGIAVAALLVACPSALAGAKQGGHQHDPAPILIAQNQTEAPPSEADESSLTEASTPDPIAIDALVRMGEELVALQQFSVRLDATIEHVMDSGQKLEFGGTAVYRVRRPNRLRVDTDTDTGQSAYFYDGATLTLSTPSKGFYGVANAKPTIRDTIEWAEDTYGLEVPLADLFDWGTERAPIDEIEVGFFVGSSRVEGVNCDHYAFRTAEVDWEVWIEAGSRPLPRKFTIIDRTQEDLPRFAATLTWSTEENFEDAIFTFSPPADALQIPLAPLTEMARLPRHN